MFNGLCHCPLSPLEMPFSHLQWEYIVQTWTTELFSPGFKCSRRHREKLATRFGEEWNAYKHLFLNILFHVYLSYRVPLICVYRTLTTLAIRVCICSPRAKPLGLEKGRILYYGNNSLISRDLVEGQSPCWADSTGIMARWKQDTFLSTVFMQI